MTQNKKHFYLNKFAGKVFVLKIGGEVVASSRILKSILLDIKNLHEHGIMVVLVHGGGPQADDLSKQLGHTPVKKDGRRVTGKKDLEVAKMLYGGSLNLEILSLMKQLKMKGLRVSGLDGDLLDVNLRSKKEFDYGFVGDVKKVNPKVLFDLMEKGYLPVVSPLGVTDRGVIVNINADTIATEIASAVKAEKMVLFTNTDGVMESGKLLRTLTCTEAQNVIKKGVAVGGMKVKLENCIDAVKRGVVRVHILNGLSLHSLLGEIYTKRGAGTMIIMDDEKKIYSNE
ncbi:MAG: acetylglutamate kinase [Candidatus Peregrinibacteria bacterium]|nr:acetylglutamate kinase [Candidatus Peregrinibacteria bacterium]